MKARRTQTPVVPRPAARPTERQAPVGTRPAPLRRQLSVEHHTWQVAPGVALVAIRVVGIVVTFYSLGDQRWVTRELAERRSVWPRPGWTFGEA
jgi:hypothetical protein